MSIIVIVDDRGINRTIYAKLAQSIGPEVEVRDFGDPAEALDWLARNRVDLILTDHDMPRIDGEEFISRFRALPHAGRVPVMMITVNDQRQARLRALESGANDFLRSPIDHHEFVMRARNLLRLAQAVESHDAAPEPAQEPAEAPADDARAGAAPVTRLVALRAKAPPPTATPTQEPKPPDWRLALRLDLVSGRVAGAQVLRGSCPAELSDPGALDLVLGAVGALRGGGHPPVRFTLAARLGPEPSAPAALRLAARLAKSGVAPCWLDLRFDAAEILAAPDRADEEARGFDVLGAALTVDLGALARGIGREGKVAAPLEQFIANWRPGVAFACDGAPDEALRLARRLGERRERPIVLIAEGVGNAALLTPLRRVGVREAQGACFGAPFSPRDLQNLFPAPERGALKRPA